MKRLFISAVFALVMAGSSFADVNRTISNEFVVALMNTPSSWSYLKNVKYNPVLNSMVGGFAPCDGTLSIVSSKRDSGTFLVFTFTSQVTKRALTCLVADVDTFLSKLAEKNKSRSPDGVVCDEGVDMSDGSRSNYVLNLSQKSFVMDFDRSDIGITVVLPEKTVKALLALR